MIDACKQFLTNRLKEILMPDGETPAYAGTSIFFGDMPRDWLKDNDYGANCLQLQDRKKKDGRLISRERNTAGTHYVFTRRRYTRTVLYRCFLYAEQFSDLWGTDKFKGFVNQLEQKTAEYRAIADSGNNCIRVDLQDAVRPWGASEPEERKDRIRRRPHKAIVRVAFTGGVHTTFTVPIIPSVEISPQHS